MKKYIYEFISKIVKVILNFIITFTIVIVASNNQNIVFNSLNHLGFTDATVQKAVLSAVIISLIGVTQAIIWLLKKGLIFILEKYLKRLIIKVDFKNNGRSKSSIKFKPDNGTYAEEHIDIEMIIYPAGKIPMFILKLLGLKIEIFFNPQIIDIGLEDDKKWLGLETSTFINSNQALSVNVLDNYRLGGNQVKAFEKTERIIILPKRVKSASAFVDYKLSSIIVNNLSKSLCELHINELDIECEGGK